MAIQKLETGQFHKLPLSEINLKPLPNLKQAFHTYYQTDDYILDALSPKKQYAQAYLNSACIKVVQNSTKLSEFFLIDNFEILHIIDRYNPKDIANQSIECLVCAMPRDDILATLAEAQLMHAKLLARAAEQSRTTFHDLLKIVHAAANDNENTDQIKPTVAPEPLPDLDGATNSNTQEHMKGQFDFFGENS